MRLRFSHVSHFGGENLKHFLLDSASVLLTLMFHDNSELAVLLTKDTTGAFVVDIVPGFIPDLPVPMPGTGFTKKQLVKLRVQYEVLLSARSKTYSLLRIVQYLAATPGKGHADDNPIYTWAPAGWLNGSGQLKVGNAATHPLVTLDRLGKNEIRFNALVVRLTELWLDLHAENRVYTLAFPKLTDATKVGFEVFGNLSGNAFVWYGVIPTHLRDEGAASPHVFFAPSDNAELQNIADDKTYLLKNTEHFKKDGRPLFNYLLPPVADVALANLPPGPVPNYWTSHRNVVGFSYLDAKHTSIGTHHWQITAGLEKAFYADAGKPKQFLLVPQNTGSGAQSAKGIQVLGPTNALRVISQTIGLVLQTNTQRFAAELDGAASFDKMVLSAYSEAGYDLWKAIDNNPGEVKGVIAIEPQNLNKDDLGYPFTKLGTEVLSGLVKEGKCQIFMVGRHHTTKYRPALPSLAGMTLMPANPHSILSYPPDPSSNAFVRYRVERMTDVTLDPHIEQAEKDLLNDLATARPPVSGKDALKKIFHRWGNVDCTCGFVGPPKCECTEKGRGSWYLHQFALSGGQVMQLPASGPVYGQAITYRTFFQEAVEKIG